MKIRISKKEAKESVYWLKHITTFEDVALNEIRSKLIMEASELILIFAAILRKLTD